MKYIKQATIFFLNQKSPPKTFQIYAVQCYWHVLPRSPKSLPACSLSKTEHSLPVRADIVPTRSGPGSFTKGHKKYQMARVFGADRANKWENINLRWVLILVTVPGGGRSDRISSIQDRTRRALAKKSAVVTANMTSGGKSEVLQYESGENIISSKYRISK